MIRTLLARSERRALSFQDIWGRGLDMLDVKTASGEVVNYDSALALSAVFAATRLLSDTISTLPLDVFVKQNGNEEQFRPLPEWVAEMNPNLRH